MSGATAEWMIVLVFFLLVIGFTIMEAVWLSRKGWAGFGKSLGFSVLTNLIGFVIGFFVIFVIFGVIFAVTWDGSINKLAQGENILIAMLILAELFTPVLLIILK